MSSSLNYCRNNFPDFLTLLRNSVKNQFFYKKVGKTCFLPMHLKNFKTFFQKTKSCFLDGKRIWEKSSSTVLGQQNYGLLRYDNSTNMPPTTFLFKWEIGHISPFFLGKNQGAPKKQHCCFCCFFEKIDLSKNTVFPKWSKFLRSKIEKKAKNH